MPFRSDLSRRTGSEAHAPLRAVILLGWRGDCASVGNVADVTTRSAGKLFDEIERSDPSPNAYRESVFHFYNRVDWPGSARVRDELEEWYSEYPDSDGDLRKRFRSRRIDQHLGAWWELWVYTSGGWDMRSLRIRRCQTARGPTSS
jgi:hypothetical protein